MRDPANQPEKLANPRPCKRYLDSDVSEGLEDGAGPKENSPMDIAEDGYSLYARRPRVRGFEEMIPAARADRIEGIFKPMIDRSYDSDY